MRTLMIVAGLAATLGLAACEQSKSAATEAAPVAKKSASRSAQMYAGQEQILEVDAATVEKSGDALSLKATGKTAMPGYYNMVFLPRINPGPPADGIYDVDVIGYRPQGAAAQVVTPVETKGEWASYPKEHLKGVRFIAKNNAVVAMLPQG
ncbi:MAG: hypothetical protein JWQ97_636 [Phenylobacterium sp.]|nr:hypothetical protein [Phenylobacterium sp.]